MRLKNVRALKPEGRTTLSTIGSSRLRISMFVTDQNKAYCTVRNNGEVFVAELETDETGFTNSFYLALIDRRGYLTSVVGPINSCNCDL